MAKTEPESLSQHQSKVAERTKLNQLRKKQNDATLKDRHPLNIHENKKVAILTNNKLVNEYQSLVYEFTKANPSLKQIQKNRRATLLKDVESTITSKFKRTGNSVSFADGQGSPARQRQESRQRRYSMAHQ